MQRVATEPRLHAQLPNALIASGGREGGEHQNGVTFSVLRDLKWPSSKGMARTGPIFSHTNSF